MGKEDFEEDDYVTMLGHRFWHWGADPFHSEHTGIDRKILICTHQKEMSPLIIVCDEDQTKEYIWDRAQVFVSIEDNPQIIVPKGAELPSGIWSQVVGWIRLNKKALLSYWYGDISTFGFCKKMRKFT